MSDVNTTVDPYYNTYDPDDEYTMVLARAGYVQQSREFNEAQSITREYLKRLSDAVVTDGTIITGCEIIISGTDITISEGTIYMTGLIRNVQETKLSITGTGKETIGVILAKTIVTEEINPSLLDPAQDFINYSKPGAHRLKETLTLVANDTTSQVIYKLEDGALINSSATDAEMVKVNDTLAVRTYDEVGNYKVSGLEIQSKGETSTDGTQLKLSISAGKAYIKGYSVSKPSAFSRYVDKALDTREVIGESKIYHAGTLQYKITNYPVCTVEQVLATISTSQPITRGNVSGSSDLLPYAPVVDITSIVAGSTTYVKGTDFQLNGDSVDWSLSGAEPSAGSTYTCVWKYNKVLTQTIDYAVTTDLVAGACYIDFTGKNGLTPVDATAMTYDYTYYLSRQDILVMDKDGEVTVLKGASDTAINIQSPDYDDSIYFRLGTVTVMANSTTAYISNNSITRITVEKLWSMMQRIEDLEYNDAVNELDTAAESGETFSTLKGILTDSFVNFDKSDLTHPLYLASIDVTDRVLVPSFTKNSTYLTLNTSGSTVTKYGTNIVANPQGTNNIIINQYNATEYISVNPYAIYTKAAVVSLSPSATSQIGVTYTSDASSNISNSIVASKYYKNSAYYENEVATLAAQGYSVVVSVNNTGNTYRYNATSSTSVSATKVTTSTKSRLYTTIPQDTITVTGENFPAYQDNISVTFDGNAVNCNPTLTAYDGTNVGTLKADVNGKTIGTFVIPANISTGVKDVVMSASTSGVAGSNATVTGSASFTSTGIVYDTYNTINHVNVVYKPYDPVAQSFSLDNNCFVTGVTLYFSSKSASANATVELRGMVNGYPSTVQYATKVLTPSMVNVSSDGSAETTVTFNDPVYCEADNQYCIVVESDATEYQLFVSTVGKTDIASGSTVYKQINSGGVLFTSSNALTWTPNQTMDLKMKLYAQNFNPSAIALFNPVASSANMLYLDTDSILPKGCTCIWQYRVDTDITKNTNNWYAITPYVQTYLPSVVSQVQIRAVLTGTSFVSPVISSNLVRLETFLFSTSCSYVTKNVVMSQAYTTIKQVASLYLPSGTTAILQFCTDGSGNAEGAWTTATNFVGTSDLGTGFTQYTYETTLGTSKTNFRARIKLTSSSATIIPKVKDFMNIIK